MTLPASGAISFNAINTELGVAGTTTANLNQSSYRTLAGVPSGAISLSNFYGKSNRVVINLVISGNTNNYNVFNNRGGTYIAGKSDITVTVNSGVTVGSTSPAGFAMQVSSFTSGDTVKIINNGTIVGCGGTGGAGNGGNGGTGGTGLYLTYPTTVTNNGTLAGGGGGGGGGAQGGFSTKTGYRTYGAGGGGGGAGVNGGAGGAGGAGSYSSGAAGASGTATAGGAGGGTSGLGGAGGTGGARGTVGSSGLGADPSVDQTTGIGAGGAAGKYLNGNAYVSYLATGTRLGPSS